MKQPLNNHKMKNRVFVFFVLLFLFSCKEEKVEFVQSNVFNGLYLIKNPSKSDSLLKTQIIDFLMKNSLKSDYLSKTQLKEGIDFYRYTSDTKYFIENEGDDTGGFSQNSITDYTEENIATFFISECKKDSTKLVGKLYFYGNAGFSSKREIDTLIYHCK